MLLELLALSCILNLNAENEHPPPKNIAIIKDLK